ncbi:MAG: hypothetical protein WC770_09965 [Phycisphaerae bacterium]|jgi:hypothetical protein
MVALPENAGVIFSWRDNAMAPHKLRLVVSADDSEAMQYPKSPSSMDFFEYGRGIYNYDTKNHCFCQSFENHYDNPRQGHYPVTKLLFSEAPDGWTIADRGKDGSLLTALTANYAPLAGAEGGANTGKAFIAEFVLPRKSPLTLACIMADNEKESEKLAEQVRSHSYARWEDRIRGHWADYVRQREAQIEKAMGCRFDRLTPIQRLVFETNLIECKLLQGSNGAMFACVGAYQLWEAHKFPAYYNSWIRDTAITVFHLTEMGLGKEFSVPHAELISRRYNDEKLMNGRFRWLDTFYNHNDKYETEYSQVDSSFYAIATFYQCWKKSGRREFVTGENYKLMRDQLRWQRDSWTFDPYTTNCINYFDAASGLFKEYRINEADLTTDKMVWYRSPKTNKKFFFVDSFYINVYGYANYLMMAEVAELNGDSPAHDEYLRLAAELKQALHKGLWREELGCYLSGMGYNGDGYEDLDYKWWNIGFDCIWALSLPEDKHLPFSYEVKNRCLDGIWRDKAWANTLFGYAEMAVQMPNHRAQIIDEIVEEAETSEASKAGILYFYPNVIPEQLSAGGGHPYNLPQIFAIAPSLRAFCLLAAEQPKATEIPTGKANDDLAKNRTKKD